MGGGRLAEKDFGHGKADARHEKVSPVDSTRATGRRVEAGDVRVEVVDGAVRAARHPSVLSAASGKTISMKTDTSQFICIIRL